MNGTAFASRRQFLRQAAAGTVTTAVAAKMVLGQGVHSGGTETLRLGLIGAGGRGTGAVTDALSADPNAKLVAIADAFPDRAESCRANLLRSPEYSSRIQVDDDHLFSDFDGYRRLIDSGVDVVLLAAPPHFRPDHLEYVVAAGKHAFVEKPVAVDVPGYHRVVAICEQAAKKGLNVVSGLCYRYDQSVQEVMRRIHEGAIGDVVAIESCYNSGTLWHRGNEPDWSRMEYQLRNWLYYTWLSGDHIVEQAIHSLDKTAWLLHDASPVKAMGMGGRQQRTQPEFGHIYDHHTVFYEYPNGVRVFFTCRQMDNCTNHVGEYVIGTEGTARITTNSNHEIDSRRTGKWRYDGPGVNMYQAEHQELFRAIREGTPINNGAYMTNSNLLAILGRMCTYSGKTLTWEECRGDTTRLGPESYGWVDVRQPPVAIPGFPETWA